MLSTEMVGLIALLILGLAARSDLVAAAAAILLGLRLMRLTAWLPVLERSGVELGLLFLTIAMLVPFALGKVNLKEVLKSFITLPGLLALAGGALATHINGRGLAMLNEQSYLMIGLILGTILGIVVLGGVPAGPLMAAGMTYLLLQGVSWATRWRRSMNSARK